MTNELKQQHSADAELRKLIEDAAKLLGIPRSKWDLAYCLKHGHLVTQADMKFNPLNPERGDLMKVAEAAELDIYYSTAEVVAVQTNDWGNTVPIVVEEFTKGDHNSLALAILRAASAVLRIGITRAAIEAAVLEEQAKAEPTGHIVVSSISEKYHAVNYDFPWETLKTLGAGRHALYLHPFPVPEGMVLVPKEPTEAMLLAAGSIAFMDELAEDYRRMIAAVDKGK